MHLSTVIIGELIGGSITLLYIVGVFTLALKMNWSIKVPVAILGSTALLLALVAVVLIIMSGVK